jgi:hypothetical protein
VFASSFVVFATSAFASFNYTFDSNAQSWQATQNFGVPTIVTTPATYVGTGGNPGGFIQLADSDSGGLGNPNPEDDEDIASFLGPALGGGSSLPNYGGTLSFDIKDSSPGASFTGTQVTLLKGTTADTSTIYPIYHVESSPSSSFATHSFTVSPGPDWYGPDGQTEATPLDLQYVLANLGEVDVLADYYDGAGETVALDNVKLTGGSTPAKLSYDRAVSIKLRKHAATGTVTVDDPDQTTECDTSTSLKVNLLFKKKGGHSFKNIGHDSLGPGGAYSIKYDHRKGTYHAQVPEQDIHGGNLAWTCATAKSKNAKLS